MRFHQVLFIGKMRHGIVGEFLKDFIKNLSSLPCNHGFVERIHHIDKFFVLLVYCPNVNTVIVFPCK